MAVYLDLQNQIANDLRRSNLGPEIASAILDAIRDHSAERFYFNETRSYTLSLVVGQDEYEIAEQAPVAEFIKIDWINAQIGSVWVNIVRQSADEIEQLQQTTSSGQPSQWAYYANKIRIFPTPDAIYDLRIAGHYRLIELVDNQDSNVWTNVAKNLIRYSTLKRLFAYPIRDIQQSQLAEAAEVRELEYLRRETDRRKRRGRMQAYY
jgi:hypothetical protein